MHTSRLCFLWLLAIFTARADTVVTLCHADAEVGVVPGPLPPRNLRGAVAAGGRITFACPAKSVLRIAAPLTVDGVTEIDGGNNVTLDAGGTTGVFRAGGMSNRTLTLRNLVVQGGKAQPAGFLNHLHGGAMTFAFTGGSHLILDHIQINGTERPVWAPFSSAVTVRDSRFAGNTGPVFILGFSGEPHSFDVHHSTFTDTRGQAFWGVETTVFIENTDVTGRADSTGEGSDFTHGALEIRNSRFSNIWSSQCGGALQSSGETTIANTSFTNNRSTCGGGAVYISSAPAVHLSNLTFTDNQTKGRGGAISFDDLDAAIDFKFGSFHNNHADFGGALAIHAGATRKPAFQGTALSFKNNSSTQNGAAVYVEGAQFQLTRGIFLENTPGTGGSLAIAAGPFVLANLLAARNAGPAAIQATVGGELVSSTIADNVGAGLLSSARMRATNCVIANNRKQNCDFIGGSAGLDDAGSNLQFPSNSCGSSITVADPMIDNFYVPDLKSPLQNAGVNAVCLAAPVFARDVYGQLRPRSSRCSIGAVEGDIAQVIRHVGDVGSSFVGPAFPSGPGGGGLSVGSRICLLLLLLLLIAFITFRFWRRLRHKH